HQHCDLERLSEPRHHSVPPNRPCYDALFHRHYLRHLVPENLWGYDLYLFDTRQSFPSCAALSEEATLTRRLISRWSRVSASQPQAIITSRRSDFSSPSSALSSPR